MAIDECVHHQRGEGADVDYTPLLETTVRRQIELLGASAALEHARTVDALEIDDEGAIRRYDGDGEAVLEALVDAYATVAGELPASLIAYALRDEFDLSAYELPENLREHL